MNENASSEETTKDRHWKAIRGALSIMGSPLELADRLRSEIDNLPQVQQDLFYHSEPFDVARDISGTKEWDPRHLAAYRELLATSSRDIVKQYRGQAEALESFWAKVVLGSSKLVAVIIFLFLHHLLTAGLEIWLPAASNLATTMKLSVEAGVTAALFVVVGYLALETLFLFIPIGAILRGVFGPPAATARNAEKYRKQPTPRVPDSVAFGPLRQGTQIMQIVRQLGVTIVNSMGIFLLVLMTVAFFVSRLTH